MKPPDCTAKEFFVTNQRNSPRPDFISNNQTNFRLENQAKDYSYELKLRKGQTQGLWEVDLPFKAKLSS